MAKNTKEQLLTEGTSLLQEFGYSDTGLQDILTAAGVPKGSFYHHFRNKEDFGLQAVQQYAKTSYEHLDAHLSDSQRPAIERVRAYFEEIFDEWIRDDCKKGCLLGTIGQELADVSETFRHTIKDSLNQWSDRITVCLSEAQVNGEVNPNIDCKTVASQLVDGFQGAALRMKLERNALPLEGFLSLYFDNLLAPP